MQTDSQTASAPPGSLHPAGSAIVHWFDLPMTKQQQKALEAKWSSHGTDRGTMILQGIISVGSFSVKMGNAKFRGAIVNQACFEQIAAILTAAQSPND